MVWVGTATVGGIGSDPMLSGMGMDPASAPEMFDAAVRAGCRVLDTADSYAGGTSERTVGRWLGGRRDVLVATKTGVRPPYPTRDLSPAHVRRSVRSSLDRLGLDRIDLLMSHRPDPVTPPTTVVRTFGELVAEGLVGHVGACNVTADEVRELLAAADVEGVPRIEWVQNRLNVVVHRGEQEVLDVCRAHDVGYIAHSVLAGGVLAGRGRREPRPGSRLAVKPEVYDRYRSPEVSAAVRAFEVDAARLGVPVQVLAQAWVLGVPGVSGLVAGPQQREHVPASVDACALRLDPDEHARIGRHFAALHGSGSE